MADFSPYLQIYGLRETPKKAPSPEDWSHLEEWTGFVFPEDFKSFYEQARYYHFEGELPSVFGKGTDGMDWMELLSREREAADVQLPRDLVPFCAVGNGDFHCFRKLDPTGATYDIVYWYGDKGADQSETPEVLASDFRSWLQGYVEDRY